MTPRAGGNLIDPFVSDFPFLSSNKMHMHVVLDVVWFGKWQIGAAAWTSGMDGLQFVLLLFLFNTDVILHLTVCVVLRESLQLAWI